LAGRTRHRTSARDLLDLLGEARGAQNPPAVGRDAQRVDEAAFERATKQRAVGAIASLRTAAERPVNRVIAGQRVTLFIGVGAGHGLIGRRLLGKIDNSSIPPKLVATIALEL
jgi:hypothetical protein